MSDNYNSLELILCHSSDEGPSLISRGSWQLDTLEDTCVVREEISAGELDMLGLRQGDGVR